MTEAWTLADTALPDGWAIDGLFSAWAYASLVKTFSQLPESSSPWIALASRRAETKEEGMTLFNIGAGDNPEQALRALAEQLRDSRSHGAIG